MRQQLAEGHLPSPDAIGEVYHAGFTAEEIGIEIGAAAGPAVTPAALYGVIGATRIDDPLALLRGFVDGRNHRGIAQGVGDSNPTSDNVVRRGRQIRLVPFAELLTRPDPEFLVEGLIEEGGFAVLYSEPKLGKSFAASAWTYCVATGRPWQGRDVKRGEVVYVAAEGVGGLPKRGRALMEHYGDTAPPTGFHFIDRAVNLLDRASVLEALAAIEDAGVDPVLVVLDTYARSMVDGDENSAKDAGRAIAAIDDLRFSLQTAVLVIHHEGKTGSSERGSGALRGAADTMLRLDRGPGGTLVLVTHAQKNWEAGPPIAIRLERVGESLVPVAVDGGLSTLDMVANGSPDPVEEKHARISAAIESLLSASSTALSQNALLGQITGGSAKFKAKVLHDLAEDPESAVTVEQVGRRKLYSWCP
jgi:hypothetical protein